MGKKKDKSEESKSEAKSKSGGAQQAPTKASQTSQNKSNVPFDYDGFWLSYIKKNTEGALERLNIKFKNYTGFLDTLSFSTFLGGIALTTYLQTTNGLVYLLVFVPILVLQVAKYFIKNIEADPDGELAQLRDMRDPVAIHRLHNSLVMAKKVEIKKAKPWVMWPTLLYVTLIPFGIYLYNINCDSNTKNCEENKEDSCDIVLEDSLIEIKAQIAGSTNHFIEIEGISNKSQKDTTVVFKVNTIGDNELASHYHPRQLGLFPKRVLLRYTQQNQQKAFFKELKIKPSSTQTKNETSQKVKDTINTDKL